MTFGVDAGDLDDDEPDAWPEEEQRRLDESVRCAICQEIFTMPVSFSTCTHTCTSWARSATASRPRASRPPPPLTSRPFAPLPSQTARCASAAR